jgi:hypothetical protein
MSFSGVTDLKKSTAIRKVKNSANGMAIEPFVSQKQRFL